MGNVLICLFKIPGVPGIRHVSSLPGVFHEEPEFVVGIFRENPAGTFEVVMVHADEQVVMAGVIRLDLAGMAALKGGAVLPQDLLGRGIDVPSPLVGAGGGGSDFKSV